MRPASIVIWITCALEGCTGGTNGTVSPSDAGDAPPSASAACDPALPHDAAGFTYTATCAYPLSDAGVPTACQEWSESADGDWTPFIVTCLDAGGTIGTVPCPLTAESGACALEPGCTDETTVFYYGAAQVASGQATCAASPGASFALTPPQ